MMSSNLIYCSLLLFVATSFAQTTSRQFYYDSYRKIFVGDEQFHHCGRYLSSILVFYCNSTPKFTDNPLKYPVESNEHHDINDVPDYRPPRERKKIYVPPGIARIVEKCCVRPCSIDELLSFCYY